MGDLMVARTMIQFGSAPCKGGLVNALHVVLMEGALVSTRAIRDQRHGDGVGSSQGIDKRVCL